MSDSPEAAATPAAANSFSTRAGAVGTPPLHYGNPLGEQRALAEGRAIVDLSDRAVITLTGEDRLSWLDSLTSQSVAKLQPGESAETLLLDPSGRVEHAMRVIDDGHVTYLLLDAAAPAPVPSTESATAADPADPVTSDSALAPLPVGARAPQPKPVMAGDPDALQTFLSRMVFTLRVEVGRADLRTVGMFVPAPPDVTSGASPDGSPELAVPAAAPHGVPLVWRDPWGSGVAAGGWQYSAPVEHPASTWVYREVLVEPDADLSAIPAAGTLALEALRIAAWRPRIGDADERTIPHELDWLRSAVHLSKGCYRGQETVAKVHNLGHPPRRVVMLHLDGSDGVLPARGSSVLLATPADPDSASDSAASATALTAAADSTAADPTPPPSVRSARSPHRHCTTSSGRSRSR